MNYHFRELQKHYTVILLHKKWISIRIRKKNRHFIKSCRFCPYFIVTSENIWNGGGFSWVFLTRSENRVCTRKNERRGGGQWIERQIGPWEGEGEKGGYQNEISQANKYSVIAGNRVIARYGAERRGFTGCGSPIHPRPAMYARYTREPAYVSAYLTCRRVYLCHVCELDTALRVCTCAQIK